MIANKSAHVSLREAAERLTQVGIGASEVLDVLSWAAENGRTIATGFPDFHTPEGSASGEQRLRISSRVWQAVRKAPERPMVRLIADLDKGSIGFAIEDRGIQETWRVVLFDRPSFDTWVVEVAERAMLNHLSDIEIDDWIERTKHTGQKRAEEDFRREYGPRAGKRQNFRNRWEAIKGHRPRGRPKKTPK